MIKRQNLMYIKLTQFFWNKKSSLVTENMFLK